MKHEIPDKKEMYDLMRVGVDDKALKRVPKIVSQIRKAALHKRSRIRVQFDSDHEGRCIENVFVERGYDVHYWNYSLDIIWDSNTTTS